MLKTFEVAIYNTDVRKAVARGEHHPLYKDEWADIHLIEVKAYSVQEARASLERRHPASKGFKIEGIMALKEFE